MKKRLLFSELSQYIDNKEALVITGMRQVGKTTLMRQVFDYLAAAEKIWFDFENPLDVKIFEDTDYNNIFNKIKSRINADDNTRIYVFIDEIQIFPEITKIIKYLIDHYQVKFIVTGSSNYYLKNLFPESLSGRKFLFQLEPLSFQEFLFFQDRLEAAEATGADLAAQIKKSDEFIHKKYEADYEEYMAFGGFPGVVTEKDQGAKKQILKNIFASFFEKDLNVLSDYKDIQELRDLLLLLVPRIGSMLDLSRLSSELAVSRPKIYQYLEFLQGTFVIRLLPKYSRGIDRSVAGGKKAYFSDTGLLGILGGVNEAQKFENVLVNQLSRYGGLSFYNKRNTAEIDLIVDKKYAFEAKLKGIAKDREKLRLLTAELGLKDGWVISKNYVAAESFISPVVL